MLFASRIAAVSNRSRCAQRRTETVVSGVEGKPHAGTCDVGRVIELVGQRRSEDLPRYRRYAQCRGGRRRSERYARELELGARRQAGLLAEHPRIDLVSRALGRVAEDGRDKWAQP